MFIGTGIRIPNPAQVTPNPLLSLIAKYGAPGLIFDNSEVYTDALGTLPAGIGDVVGNEADHSGGSHDISQATTAAKPILRAGPLLEFDGTDDYLSGVNVFTGAELTLIWCGKFRSVPSASNSVFGFGDSASAANYATFMGNAGGNLQAFITGNLTSAADFNIVHTASPALTTKSIVSVRGKANVQELSQNQSRTVTSVITSPVLDNADIFSCGALLRTAPAAFSDTDQDYVFVINKYLTTAELEQAEEYIANLCGVTLP